jgi:hypothetical protein
MLLLAREFTLPMSSPGTATITVAPAIDRQAVRATKILPAYQQRLANASSIKLLTGMVFYARVSNSSR